MDTISQYSGQIPFWEGTSDFHYELKLYMKGLCHSCAMDQ